MPYQKNTPDLFWSRVRKSSKCWEYKSPRSGSSQDYPQIRYGGKYWVVSRLSWFLSFGEIPEGMFICHHCDNPKCVRPDHLFVGTADDNNKDKAKKGRAKSGGEKLRKLSNAELLSAFMDYNSGKSSMRKLSVKLGLSQPKLSKWFSRIRSGRLK